VKIRRKKTDRLTDGQLAELWAQSSRREYPVALVLRYLPLLYGVALKFAGSEEGAREEVLAFAGEFDGGQGVYDAFRRGRERARVLGGRRGEFVQRLAEGDEQAVAAFEQARAGLSKPQRECVEMLLRRGGTFETIAAGTGYLTDRIRHYVETAMETLAGDDDGVGDAAEGAPAAVCGHFAGYVKGAREGAEANAIEVASMLDPFVSDALEGVLAVRGDHARRIAELDREIEARHFTPRAKLAWLWIALGAAGVIGAVALILIYMVPMAGVKVEELPDPKAAVEVPVDTVAVADSVTVRDSIDVADSLAVPVVPVAEETVDVPEAAKPQAATGRVSFSITKDGVSGKYVSAPLIGLKRYGEYLNESAVPLSDGARGEVTLTFVVNHYGRPSRIRVVGFLSQEAHREAIRLLESGPEWHESDREATVVIRFE
jgi:hypothetical protein